MLFLSRQQVFDLNPVLARYVFEMQQARLDGALRHYQAGDAVMLRAGNAAATVLSGEDAQRLNEQEIESCRPLLDDFDAAPTEVAFSGLVIGELAVPDWDEFCQQVGGHLSALWQALGAKRLVVLPDVRQPFLGGCDSREQNKELMAGLLSMGLSGEYDAAIEPEASETSALFSWLFQLVRYNVAAPSLLITGENVPIIGVLCHYGNIHFECFDQPYQQRLEAALIKAGFEIAPDAVCRERFSRDGKIEGRSLAGL